MNIVVDKNMYLYLYLAYFPLIVGQTLYGLTEPGSFASVKTE